MSGGDSKSAVSFDEPFQASPPGSKSSGGGEDADPSLPHRFVFSLHSGHWNFGTNGLARRERLGDSFSSPSFVVRGLPASVVGDWSCLLSSPPKICDRTHTRFVACCIVAPDDSSSGSFRRGKSRRGRDRRPHTAFAAASSPPEGLLQHVDQSPWSRPDDVRRSRRRPPWHTHRF